LNLTRSKAWMGNVANTRGAQHSVRGGKMCWTSSCLVSARLESYKVFGLRLVTLLSLDPRAQMFKSCQKSATLVLLYCWRAPHFEEACSLASKWTERMFETFLSRSCDETKDTSISIPVSSTCRCSIRGRRYADFGSTFFFLLRAAF